MIKSLPSVPFSTVSLTVFLIGILLLIHRTIGRLGRLVLRNVCVDRAGHLWHRKHFVKVDIAGSGREWLRTKSWLLWHGQMEMWENVSEETAFAGAIKCDTKYKHNVHKNSAIKTEKRKRRLSYTNDRRCVCGEQKSCANENDTNRWLNKKLNVKSPQKRWPQKNRANTRAYELKKVQIVCAK